MSYQYVLTDRRERVGYLTLNRPEKLNALHRAFVEEILAGLRELEEHEGIRVIVIKAKGRSFSVGGDPSPEGAKEFALLDTALEYKKVAKMWLDASRAVRALSKPTIVQIHGHFLAGATDLFLHCDFLIATQDAQIGCPDVRGMESPLCHAWTYLVGPQWARYFLLTGDNVDGATAERIGLVMKAVAPETLEEELNALARRIALIPLDFLAPNKSLVNEVLDNMGYAAAQPLAAAASTLTHLAPEVREFHRISAEKGFKAAFAWREENPD